MKKLLPILLSHERELAAGFENAIRIAMHEAKVRSIKPEPEEPDYVAMLVLKGVPYIAATLRNITRRYGIRATVSSIFCHQKPVVQFNRKQDSCELGDILIVHRHSDSRSRTTYSNSLLLQAKVSSVDEYEIPYKEKHQLRLYQSWPKFTYVRSGGALNGQDRDVRPKARHSGAQYLLIDGRGMGAPASGLLGLPGTHCMAIWPATPVLYAHYSLATELVRFLVGLSGRSFVDSPKDDPTGWSSVVWDILKHSVSFVFNRKNIGVKSTSRLGGDPMTSSLTGANFCVYGDGVTPDSMQGMQDMFLNRFRELRNSRNGEPPLGDSVPDDNSDNMGGVSIILIETSDSD